jgi:hypothetical protein
MLEYPLKAQEDTKKDTLFYHGVLVCFESEFQSAKAVFFSSKETQVCSLLLFLFIDSMTSIFFI